MKIGVILVTFNRLDKLKVALSCYDKQEFRPEYVYVVNNHSTDGTDEYLKEWQAQPSDYAKYVLELPYNSGGAGGFHVGLEAGMKLDADWLWVSDDDAYPKEDAFQKIADYYKSCDKEDRKKIAALCSTVINEGEIHYAHRNRVNRTKLKCKMAPSTPEDYKKEAFEIDVFSYVGTLLRKEALDKAGLPEKDFFIYCDDQEHALRVGKTGKILVVSDSIVVHNTPGFGKKEAFWGDYYFARNNTIMLKKHFSARYYLLKAAKAYITKASILSKNPKNIRKMYAAAYKDAFRNRIGIHETYKPGWNPKEENEK